MATTSVNAIAPGGVNCPVSTKADWATLVADAKTVDTLFTTPLAATFLTDTQHTVTAVGANTGRVRIHMRYAGTGTVTLAPSFYVYGITGSFNGSTWSAGTRVEVLNGGSPYSITASTGSDPIDGGGFRITIPAASLNGEDIDLKGATHLLIMISTAGTGTAAQSIVGQFVN